MTKGTDLSKQSAADLRRIQRSLNDRPRKTLGYTTPSEADVQAVAATASFRHLIGTLELLDLLAHFLISSASEVFHARSAAGVGVGLLAPRP